VTDIFTGAACARAGELSAAVAAAITPTCASAALIIRIRVVFIRSPFSPIAPVPDG
jgi:hypothetical protein